VKGLDLTPEQQGKLDPILQESRQKLLALQGAGLSEADRRTRSQKIREAAREKIRDILTPEQRARYDQLAADQAGAARSVAGRVWALGTDGKPAPLTLQLGISDGNFTEVLEGSVTEGQEVVVGSTERPAPRQGPGSPRLRL